jgi:hypothetical protein
MIKILIFCFLALFVVFTGACQSKTHERDSIRIRSHPSDLLSKPFKEERRVKKIKILFFKDSIVLNNKNYQDTVSFFNHIESIFYDVYSSNKSDSIIGIQVYYDPTVDFNEYNKFYNRLSSIYHFYWNQSANGLFDSDYNKLSEDEKRRIKDLIPFYLKDYPFVDK